MNTKKRKLNKREKLIAEIKTNDRFYKSVNFVGYSDKQLKEVWERTNSILKNTLPKNISQQ